MTTILKSPCDEDFRDVFLLRAVSGRYEKGGFYGPEGFVATKL